MAVLLREQSPRFTTDLRVAVRAGMLHDPHELGGIAHLCEHLFVRYLRDLQSAAGYPMSLRSAHTYFSTTELALNCSADIADHILTDLEHGNWEKVASRERIERELLVIRRELSDSEQRGLSGYVWRHVPPLMYDDWAHSHDGFGATLASDDSTARAVTQFFAERYRLRNADVWARASPSSEPVRKTLASPLERVGPSRNSPAGLPAQLATGRCKEELSRGLDLDILSWHLTAQLTTSPLVSTEYLASVMSRRVAVRWRETMDSGYASVTVEPGFFGPLLPGMPPCVLVIAHPLRRARRASLDELTLCMSQVLSQPVSAEELEMSRTELKTQASSAGETVSAVRRFAAFGETLSIDGALSTEQASSLAEDITRLLTGISTGPDAVLRVYSER